jgi:hypothetical protein
MRRYFPGVGRERQRTAHRHRIARVQAQIQQRVLDLRRIAGHDPVRSVQVRTERDAPVHAAPQDLRGLSDQLVDIDGDALLLAFARERQQLAR